MKQNSNTDDEQKVSIEVFGEVLAWFGPLEIPEPFVQPKNLPLLQKIRELCSKAYFFGNISTQEASNHLANQPIGTFLVRFSSSQPGSYTLSRVDHDSNIAHTRIPKEKGMFIADGKKYDSVMSLVKDMRSACALACPGSMFASLFSTQQEVGYPGQP